MHDPVAFPEHYTSGDVECIDAIRSVLGSSFVEYCQGNVLKYVWRHGAKGNPVQDLKKARYYLERMIEEYERGS